jgi:single-strand DNA-binding protein
MAANNHVSLIGNLTRDPEIRVTPKGTSIVSFSLAVNRKWKNEAGQVQEEVTFVECEMWGKGGEAFAKYHKKGVRAAVSGRLKMDQWEDKKTNEKRSRLKVVADEFEFVNSRPVSNGGGADQEEPSAPPPARSSLPQPAPGLEDDVPF